MLYGEFTMIELTCLLRVLQAKRLAISWEGPMRQQNIERLANDSRKVGPGDLFVALRGTSVDGHMFIEKAVKNGAIAIVCEAMPEVGASHFSGIAFIRVTNAHTALAELASAFYGYPSHSLRSIGITGTNGKTTTAFLIHHLLSELDEKCGLISTIEYRFGATREAATHTTPDALALQRVLRRMADRKCHSCVMEVSSHALVQRRVEAIAYQAGIFTNLTQDHLDYHGTMRRYREAKKMLFDGLTGQAHAIYNVDDAAGAYMVTHTAASKVAYSLHQRAAVRGRVRSNTLSGIRIRIDGVDCQFKLVGYFNAYNLLAAYATGLSSGFTATRVLDALQTAGPVPGRFEIVPATKNRYVIIDYAHTPDALDNVLRTLRQTMDPRGRLWCLFGCGGDRDQKKRPLMGHIAEQLSDHIVVTSDNPRTEDPERIIYDIKSGLSKPELALSFSDRRTAILEAASRSGPNDVVLIAGKGHEQYQIIQNDRRPFDDKKEALDAFGARLLRTT